VQILTRSKNHIAKEAGGMPICFSDRRFGLRLIAKEDVDARIVPESGKGVGIRAMDKFEAFPSVLHYCGTGTNSNLMCAEDLEASLKTVR
jgi:hypothetical protein